MVDMCDRMSPSFCAGGDGSTASPPVDAAVADSSWPFRDADDARAAQMKLMVALGEWPAVLLVVAGRTVR